MPAQLEAKLKAEYGAKSDIPYKIMNHLGYMAGSKETPKGSAMEAKMKSDYVGKYHSTAGAEHP